MVLPLEEKEGSVLSSPREDKKIPVPIVRTITPKARVAGYHEKTIWHGSLRQASVSQNLPMMFEIQNYSQIHYNTPPIPGGEGKERP